jgi:hypothetical protein
VVGVVQETPRSVDVGEADQDRAVRWITLGGLGVEASGPDRQLGTMLLRCWLHRRHVPVSVMVDVVDLLHQDDMCRHLVSSVICLADMPIVLADGGGAGELDDEVVIGQVPEAGFSQRGHQLMGEGRI